MAEFDEFWDDEDIASGPDSFIKFENMGDTVTGKILSMSKQRFKDDAGNVKTAPTFVLETEDGNVGVTCGANQLRALLIERRPRVGDELTITLRTQPRKGMAKEFVVRVNGE